MSKYDLNSAEERYQSGSNDTVLANMLGIIDAHEMDVLESGLLLMLYEKLFIGLKPSDKLTFEHIRYWHYQWLGNVYQWAGKFRQENLTKDGFQFAAADRIPLLITGFERQFLHRYGELKTLSRVELVKYLAECHVEFILIHPLGKGTDVWLVCFLMCRPYSQGPVCWIIVCGIVIKCFTSERFRRE